MSQEEELEQLDRKPLHPSTKQRVRAVRLGITLDGWAVIIAVVLAIVVRFGAQFGVTIPW